jgi:hypothetical protein
VFRWQPAPGVSYQGFVKMLAKWQPELLGVVIAYLREQMQEMLPAQWETAGYVVFAGDGSRVALARSESLEATFAPARSRPWVPVTWVRQQTRHFDELVHKMRGRPYSYPVRPA